MFLLPPPTLELFSPFHSSFFLLCYHFLSIHLSLFFSESYLQMSAGLNYFWDVCVYVCVFSQGGVFSLKWSISLRLVTLEPQLHSQQVHVCTHTHSALSNRVSVLLSCFHVLHSSVHFVCWFCLCQQLFSLKSRPMYVCVSASIFILMCALVCE